jgi:hypothetical protein
MLKVPPGGNWKNAKIDVPSSLPPIPSTPPTTEQPAAVSNNKHRLIDPRAKP